MERKSTQLQGDPNAEANSQGWVVYILSHGWRGGS